ncbi:hypothetical protein Tco_1176952 [Tanacetum coccineum]
MHTAKTRSGLLAVRYIKDPTIRRYQVWSTGIPERSSSSLKSSTMGVSTGELDQPHPWRIREPEETSTKCHTMPVVPILSRKVPSSDDRRDADDLDQQSPLVDSAIVKSPDDDASELGSGAKVLTKGSLSAGAKGFTSKEFSAATPWCTEED